MKSTTVCLAGLFLFLACAGSVSASSEFTVAYDVRYDVQANGNTHVTQRIALTNTTNRFYANQYRLSVRNRALTNVKASDGGGQMPVTVTQTDDGYEVHVTFNEKIVGSDKVLNWVLSYELPDAARKNGLIWEIVIPGIIQSEQITSYRVTLAVPSSFGEHSFLSPQPVDTQTSASGQLYRFEQESVIKSGVTAIFGTLQRYRFTLFYHLANPNLVPVRSEIALPPDNAYQDVQLVNITPKPLDVRVDEDSNYLAAYELNRGQRLEIKATGIIEVHQKPRKPLAPLSDEARKRYLQPHRYWEVTNPLIGEKARELETPRAIYQFVTQYLAYSQERLNTSKLERLGAVAALSRPNEAVCMEYTDLFIALARAAGIPAREVNGYAYTYDTKFRPLSLKNNADILHSWPEYWNDELGWVAVDPTWGSTTGGINYFDQLDFNHLAFVIHGVSSTEPYPAGAYKYDSNQGPDVAISFTEDIVERSSTIELALALRSSIISGFETPGKVLVRNTGTVATVAGTISLTAQQIRFITPQAVLVGTVPPFAAREIEFILKSDGWFRRGDDEIGARLGDSYVTLPVHIVPLPFIQLLPWIGGIVGGTAIVFVGYGVVARYRLKRLALPKAPVPSGKREPISRDTTS